MTTRDALNSNPAGTSREADQGSIYPPQNLDAIFQIPLSVKVVLGSATISIASLSKLGRGAVIALNKRVGEPVDITVNGRLIARGEVVVLEDDNSRFGISLTEVIGLQAPLQERSPRKQ